LRRRGALSLAAIAIAIATIVLVQHLSLKPQRTSASIPPAQKLELPLSSNPSIAVLPFANVSGDPGQEYFSDGVTDQIITDLSRLPGLFVIDRNSAFTYKGKAIKVQELSRQLGVRLVLEGTVRRANNRVRIGVQLVDAITGANLWAQRFDRPPRDIFAVQDEIVQKIVTTLDLVFKLGERGVPAGGRAHGTDNLEAFDDFLRGIWYAFSMTQAGNAQARRMYEKAIVLDPTYADAYVALGSTYFAEWFSLWSHDPQKLNRASELARRAIALDDSLPGAYQLVSMLDVFKERRYDRGIADAKRAIALDANSASGYFVLAMVLDFSGMPAAGIESLNKAMLLDPLNRDYYLIEVGFAYALMGRYSEAVLLHKRFLARYPDSMSAHLQLAVIYVELGRQEEARAEAAEVMRISPRFSIEAAFLTFPLKDRALSRRYAVDCLKAGLK
jgi:adenylate cyclase